MLVVDGPSAEAGGDVELVALLPEMFAGALLGTFPEMFAGVGAKAGGAVAFTGTGLVASGLVVVLGIEVAGLAVAFATLTPSVCDELLVSLTGLGVLVALMLTGEGTAVVFAGVGEGTDVSLDGAGAAVCGACAVAFVGMGAGLTVAVVFPVLRIGVDIGIAVVLAGGPSAGLDVAGGTVVDVFPCGGGVATGTVVEFSGGTVGVRVAGVVLFVGTDVPLGATGAGAVVAGMGMVVALLGDKGAADWFNCRCN